MGQSGDGGRAGGAGEQRTRVPLWDQSRWVVMSPTACHSCTLLSVEVNITGYLTGKFQTKSKLRTIWIHILQ